MIKNLGLAAAALLYVMVPTALPGGGKSAKLPDAVVKALKDAFPKTAIPKVGQLDKDGIWEVSLGKKGEMFAKVINDGTLMSVAAKVAEKDLTDSVIKSIKEKADGGKIVAVQRTERRAVFSNVKNAFVKLDKPRVAFTVTVVKQSKTATLTVNEEGGLQFGGARFEWKDLPHAAGVAGPGQIVIRVACGNSKNYEDLSGAVWFADQKYSKDKKWGWAGMDKTAHREGITIAGTDAPELYLRERYYMDNYRFDVPNGKYTVRVHMCETWEGASKPGQRSFGLKIQDQVVQKVDFDLVRDVGFMKPYIKEVKDVNVTDGKIIVHFIDNGKHQHPLVNAIEVIGPVEAGAKQGD